jgi:NAD(P)-dependent dehydrogenase (short-subunit alcohol dehydrogenase family)
VAIVTGAASGLGLAIATRLAADDVTVVVADQNAEGAQSAVRTITRSGGLAHAWSLDVSAPESVQRMVDDTIQRHGQLDIMVSNAGIGELYHFLDQPFDRWERTLAVNLTGVFLCGQAAARAMAPRRQGCILNVASVAGLRAGSGRTAYGTSKAGVIHLTRQMALDLGPLGINVNAIAPGPVDTPMVMEHHTPETRLGFTSMIPMHRYGRPEEIASVAAFLTGDQARYVNGQTIYVDGGFTAVGVIADDVAPRLSRHAI